MNITFNDVLNFHKQYDYVIQISKTENGIDIITPVEKFSVFIKKSDVSFVSKEKTNTYKLKNYMKIPLINLFIGGVCRYVNINHALIVYDSDKRSLSEILQLKIDKKKQDELSKIIIDVLSSNVPQDSEVLKEFNESDAVIFLSDFIGGRIL